MELEEADEHMKLVDMGKGPPGFAYSSSEKLQANSGSGLKEEDMFK